VSTSIYYEARRSRPLDPSEQEAIARIEKAYAVEAQIERYASTGEGPNWESFCVYDPADPTGPDVVFEGATKLPDNSDDHTVTGVTHWCRALSEIRLVLADADWWVHIDDADVPWNEELQQWDPWAAEEQSLGAVEQSDEPEARS
jgi:hypothetical protein